MISKFLLDTRAAVDWWCLHNKIFICVLFLMCFDFWAKCICTCECGTVSAEPLVLLIKLSVIASLFTLHFMSSSGIFFFTWSGSGNILEFVVYDDLFCTEDGAFCPSLVPFMFTAWSFQFTGLFFWPHAMLLSLLEFVLLNLKLLPRILLFLLFLSLYFVCWNELWKW